MMHCKTHQLHGKSPRHRTDLRFYGELHFRKKDGTSYGDWMGVELDAPLGKNDGSFAVKRSSGDTELRRYFQCEQLHGLFALVNSKQIQLDLDGDSGSDESTDSEDEGKADVISPAVGIVDCIDGVDRDGRGVPHIHTTEIGRASCE